MRVSNDSPVLIDHFLEDAIEVDVDASATASDVLIGGIMEHIEEAGVHSGDSGCSLPPHTLSPEIQAAAARADAQAREALNVVGLMNIQFAIQNGVVHILEVNPRASRTVPFVSKATGVPLAKIAARVMTGRKLARARASPRSACRTYCQREGSGVPVRRSSPRPIRSSGPEMKSTGEVMGTGRTFGEAFAKAQAASGVTLPRSGVCLISVRERDKPGACGWRAG